MTRTRFASAVLVAGALMMSAACGDDSAGTPSSSDAPSTATASTVVASTSTAPATTTTAVATPTTAVTTPPTTAVPDGLVALDPGPLSPRWEVAVTATEQAIMVYGGTAGGAALDDGAAYDTATGQWSVLPSSNGLAPGATAAMPVGTLVAFAGPGGVATLDPAAGTWTALDPTPYPQGRIVVSSGTMLALESNPARGVDGTPGAQAMAVLDPAGGTWSALPPVAVAEIIDVVVAGGEVVVVAMPTTDAPDRAALRLDDAVWTDLGMPALDWFFGSFAFTDGSDVFVWANASPAAPGANDHGVAFSVSGGQWSDTPPLPGDAWECYASAVAAGATLYIDNCAATARYDVSGGELTAGEVLAPEAQSTESLVALDGAVYRWGAAYCYADCSDPPDAVYFHRLAAGL